MTMFFVLLVLKSSEPSKDIYVQLTSPSVCVGSAVYGSDNSLKCRLRQSYDLSSKRESLGV